MKKMLFPLFACCLITEVGFAQQDYHFSQFFAAPITYNPANSGAFEGGVRGMVNYRSQYTGLSEGYKTFGFTADAPIRVSSDARDLNHIGVGLSVVNDNAGIVGFNNFSASGNVAYAIDLGGTAQDPKFISLGLQFGFMQRSLDLTKASWEQQWTGTSFNQGLASGESATGSINESNVDLGAGVSWYNSINANTRMLIGGAVLHANAPQVELIGNDEALRRKYVGHFAMSVSPNGSQVTYLPNVFLMFQGPNRIIDVGSEIEFSLWDRTQFTDFRNNLSLNLGAYYRVQDALYFIARANYYDFSLGISYDFTVSSLAENNQGRGGVELVLAYRTSFSGPGVGRQRLIKSKGL